MMSDSKQQDNKLLEEWMKATTIPKAHLNHFKEHILGRAERLQPSYYTDVNGKEWIILLMPDPDSTETRLLEHSTEYHDGYLYDVANDKMIEFIHSYEKDINQRFKINYPFNEKATIGGDYLYRSYVIDNNNHVMYWYISGYGYTRKSEWSSLKKLECLILAFDIKNLKNIQLLYQQQFSNDEFPDFAGRHYKMIMVNDTIQILLGSENWNEWRHYEFNTKTKKLRVVHKNIHSRYTKHVTKEKLSKFFENLAVGDWIDIRTGIFFHLAKIQEIKDKKFDDENQLISLKAKVTFKGHPKDCWISVNKEIQLTEKARKIDDQDLKLPASDIDSGLLTQFCDCTKQCHFADLKYNDSRYLQYHRFALPKSHTTRLLYTIGLHVVYSENHQKLIILGRNDPNTSYLIEEKKWCGLYYTYINRKYKDCILIIDGFIRQFETMIDHVFVNIPKDINEMILKYYFIPNDNEWTRAIKIDENGKFIRDTFSDHLYTDSGCVLANNDNDIFMFGGNDKRNTSDILRYNIGKNTLRRLTDIGFPQAMALTTDDYWKSVSFAVFCKKTKNIHLFSRDFSIHLWIPLERLNLSSSVLLDQ